jgi:DNA replication and repair protein RecF
VSRAALLSLTLTDFRSYERATLRPEGASVYLFGANGAGKTNLLEAISACCRRARACAGPA